MRKKVLALVLMGLLTVGMVLPVQAAKMENFPVQKLSSNSPQYTRAIQVMMLNYNSTTRAYIINSGGVDGSYGYATADAIEAFQVSKNIEVDGSCGPETWKTLRNSLIYKTLEGSYKIYKGPYPYWSNQYNMKQYNSTTGSWYCYAAYNTWKFVG